MRFVQTLIARSVMLLIMIVVAVWGVGCGGNEGVYEEAVETAGLELDITSEGADSGIDFEGLLLDVSDGTSDKIGGRPERVDTANSTCFFTVIGTSGALTGDANIELKNSAVSLNDAESQCTNINNCIYCYVVATDESGTCSVTCAGAIATTTEASDDYFDIQITTTHAFTTEMEADGQGMIRIDGSINFGDGVDNLTYVSQDFVQTNCSDAAAVVVEDESNTTLTGLTVDGDAYDATSSDGVYHEFYEITTSAASEGNSKSCTVQDVVTARCTVPTDISSNTVLDCSAVSPWQNGASICEGQDICAKTTF